MTGTAPLTVNFKGNGSSDPDLDPLTYGWDLNNDSIFTDSTAVQKSHTFTQPGSHIVRLRVTDSKGAVNTASVLIVVSASANIPPVASINTPVPGTS